MRRIALLLGILILMLSSCGTSAQPDDAESPAQDATAIPSSSEPVEPDAAHVTEPARPPELSTPPDPDPEPPVSSSPPAEEPVPEPVLIPVSAESVWLYFDFAEIERHQVGEDIAIGGYIENQSSFIIDYAPGYTLERRDGDSWTDVAFGWNKPLWPTAQFPLNPGETAELDDMTQIVRDWLYIDEPWEGHYRIRRGLGPSHRYGGSNETILIYWYFDIV